MARVIRHLGQAQTEFTKLYAGLCDRHQSWEVWSDFVYMAAAAITNAVDRSEKAAHREKEYLKIIGKYNKIEQAVFPQLLTTMVDELEIRPEQDFLGEMFMALELGNHWKGQFFTPYSVCKMMAEININGIEEKIDRQGFVSICDPACGAGALLVAARNVMLAKEIDWSTKALFVAQDIDVTAALMCYIQLSLLGCAGYVCIGNTLTNPLTGADTLFPLEQEGQDIWYTPLWYHNVWQGRRLWRSLGLSLGKGAGGSVKQEEPEGGREPAETKAPPLPPLLELKSTDSGQLTLF